ncbi:hypothetical protein BH20CHL6_BH20CHL6_17320 [soil metagenome]
MEPVRPSPRSRRQPLRRLLTASAVALMSLAVLLPGTALGVGDTLEVHRPSLRDRDTRTGKVLPNSTQKSIVSSLGATVAWNRYGTPQSLLKRGGYLATGLSGQDAAAAARSWIVSKKALFRLSSVTTSNLVTLNDSPMVGSNGHAVVFRQRFGTLPAAQDGLITVGIVGTRSSGWKIAYVSSSAVGTKAAPLAATLSAPAAWLRAARNVGDVVGSDKISGVRTERGWTVFNVAGFSETQRARLVALPRPGQSVRAAWETWLIDVDGGETRAFRHFIDARTGATLVRTNQVYQLAEGVTPAADETVAAAPQTFVFQGTYADDTLNPEPDPNVQMCGAFHGPYTAPAGTESITVVAATAVTSNDIYLELFKRDTPPSTAAQTDPSDTAGRVAGGPGAGVGSGDSGTSPEVLTYDGSPSSTVPAGTYYARVCPFNPPSGPPAPPYTYAGTVTVSDEEANAFPFPPKWRYFRSNPALDLADTDFRRTGCWIDATGCDFELENLAARVPWDHNVQTNQPTFTTIGNYAITGEAWGSPLTPAEPYRPVDPNREYIFPFENRWNNAQCSQTEFIPGVGNDIDAATTSLFANHNRVHDWSYYLGFTERNYNMQVNNFGLTSPQRENDPEIGNVQAGAVSGGPPTYLGRDNANQVPTPDGVPGITNMYLWQPIAAGFYAPCVDGDFDMSVIAHEYGHQIQHRMIAGPDAGISSDQGRQMGESWSDLTAIEYLSEYNYYCDLYSSQSDPTTCTIPSSLNQFAVGPYVTGSPQKGIRNYGMNASPLNWSNLDYDPHGVAAISPHANGEIWSAVNFDIRQALAAKYNGTASSTNRTLQRQCADGERPVDQCPGNRRWFQILMDAFLLMPSDISMITARDAYLAADIMRFGGANQRQLWDAFARRGFGSEVLDSQVAGDDVDAPISFRSATRTNAQHARIVFRTVAAPGESGMSPNAKIYVGRYEARSVPIMNAGPTTPLTSERFFTPGTYEFVAVAPGYGHFRFTRTLTASSTRRIIKITMPRNWASRAAGGSIASSSPAAGGTSVNTNKLIDDTEATNWAVLGATPNANNSSVTVNLAGTAARLVSQVRVSALTRPRIQDDEGDDPVVEVGDTESQSRFSAMRSFAIETCNGSATFCSNPLNFTRIYTSPANAFPGSVPRPLAPDLLLRTFNVPDTMATHVRLVALTNQCTGGPAYEGDQDLDPLNNSDCQTGSTQDQRMRASELQVISQAGGTQQVEDPVVTMSMSGPTTASAGDRISFTTTYKNLGPKPSSSARITQVLPAGLTFRSASGGGTYNASNRTVTWSLGTVGVNVTGTVRVTVDVGALVTPGTVFLNLAEFKAPLTVANPAVMVTTIL